MSVLGARAERPFTLRQILTLSLGGKCMGYLDKLDLDKKLESKEEYEELLQEYQFKLLKLQRKSIEKGIAVAVAYEGCDAAGKGGNIKRVTESLDPRGYEVHPIGAPTAAEKAHHWLRRFWLRMPPRGRIGIFDRTWYGRVLVERVEKFAKKEEWQRAYREINEFERTLADDGHGAGQVLDSHLQEGAARSLQEAREGPLEELEADGRGLAQSGKVGRLHRGPGRDVREDGHGLRSLDHHRGKLEVVGAYQSFENSSESH